MNIKRYFETDEKEPRLIDLIAFFYLVNVLAYTSDDLKGNYPILLVTMGLIFHSLAVFAWIDGCKVRSKFRPYRRVIHKLLTIGLALTYLSSILFTVQTLKLMYANYYSIAYFILIAMPMIMFFSSIGFKIKSFDFLKQQRKGINNLFIVLAVLMLVGQKIVNN